MKHAPGSGRTWIRHAAALAAVAALMVAVSLYIRKRESRGPAAGPSRPAAPASPESPTPSGQAPPVPPGVERDLRRLNVRIVDPAGRPVPGAKVICGLRAGSAPVEGTPAPTFGPSGVLRKAGAIHPIAHTDGKGRTTVVVDPARLGGTPVYLLVRALAEGFAEDAHSMYVLNVPPAGASRDLLLRPRRGRHFTGRLMNLDPTDAGDIYVRVREKDPEGEPWMALPDVGADGTFRAAEAPEVALELSVEHSRDKYKPVRMNVDPRAGEIVVALERDPQTPQAPRLIVEVAPPPGVQTLGYRLLAFSAVDPSLVMDQTGDTTHALTTTALDPGAYRVLAVGLAPHAVWGETAVTLVQGASQRVRIPTRPAASVRVRLLDGRTGKPPELASFRARLHWAPDGHRFVAVAALHPRGPEDYGATGELVGHAPPGTLKVVVDDRDGRYAPASRALTLGEAESRSIDLTLLPP